MNTEDARSRCKDGTRVLWPIWSKHEECVLRGLVELKMLCLYLGAMRKNKMKNMHIRG